ncbi:MAG: hypothetical protein AAGE52_39145 [Myxococcota bacterium]
MTELTHQLDESRARLRAQLEDFVQRTREASATFMSDTRGAGRKLGGTTKAAGGDLIQVVREEFADFSALAREKARAVPGLVEAPEQLQATMLLRLKRTLDAIDVRVSKRLDDLAQPALDVEVPLEGYDDMTAKEVLAALAELDEDARDAVVAYEKAHKRRATILKAAKAA